MESYLNYLYLLRGFARYQFRPVPAWLDWAIERAEMVLGYCPVYLED